MFSNSIKIIISRHYLYVLRIGSSIQLLVVHRLYRDDEEKDRDREVEDDKTKAYYIEYNSREASCICVANKSIQHTIQF